jgi:O-antigen ligase
MRHRSKPHSPFENGLFAFYLGVICWTPLPKASNNPWSLNLLCLLCFLLCAAVIASKAYNPKKILTDLVPYKYPIVLLTFVAAWASFQTVSLPQGLLDALSPAKGQLVLDTAIASTKISLDPSETVRQALFSWALVSFFICTVLLIDSRNRLRTLLWVIVACGVFQALYGSFMTLSGLEYGFFHKKYAYLGRATGTFINRNHLAGYLEMCLAIGIGLLVATLKQGGSVSWRQLIRNTLDTLLGSKLRLRVFLAFMVIALVLTRSRMGNGAFFISLPLCALLMMIAQRKLHKGAIILFASLILVDFLIIGQWFGFDELADRVQDSSSQSETRDEVTRDSLVMLQDYSLTGTGLGTFYSSYIPYKGDDVRGYYDHAHNDILEFAITLGLIGYAPLVLLLLSSLIVAIQTLYKRRDQLAKGVAFAASMGIISLLIHSAVDFNLHIPANAMIFTVILALAWISNQLPRARQQQ